VVVDLVQPQRALVAGPDRHSVTELYPELLYIIEQIAEVYLALWEANGMVSMALRHRSVGFFYIGPI